MFTPEQPIHFDHGSAAGATERRKGICLKYNPEAHERHGFTLVELLVVIAVLALVAAIGFSAIQMARQKAGQVQEISSVRSIGMAVLQYGNSTGNFPSVFASVYPHKTPDNRYLFKALEEIMEIEELADFQLATSYVSPLTREWYEGLPENEKENAITGFLSTAVTLEDGTEVMPFGRPMSAQYISAPATIGILSRMNASSQPMYRSTTSYDWEERSQDYPPRKFHPDIYFDGHVEMNER